VRRDAFALGVERESDYDKLSEDEREATPVTNISLISRTLPLWRPVRFSVMRPIKALVLDQPLAGRNSIADLGELLMSETCLARPASVRSFIKCFRA